MYAPHEREFREDVVRAARAREGAATVTEIEIHLAIHEVTLHKWPCQGDLEGGTVAGRRARGMPDCATRADGSVFFS